MGAGVTGGTAEALTIEELSQLCALLRRCTGMIFGEKKRYYLERRIAALMKTAGIADAGTYLLALANDPAERQKLINAVTVNETYFYREDRQFAALSERILPAIVQDRRPGDRVRIWSLPCSTGDECYSIAIWLLENWALVDAYLIEIVGSDIDTRALAAAREGRYGTRALSHLPDSVREAYFESEQRHERQIIRDLRESVGFTQANIVDRQSMRAAGRFDVILCRNLLIYFDEEGRRTAAENLYDALNPGGFLCLGHSESMARIDPRFTLVRLGDAIVYRRD